MRKELYSLLVNKSPGICDKYHNFHDGKTGLWIPISWLYLIWLNFAYYILCFKWIGKTETVSIYEEKHLYIKGTEETDPKHGSKELSIEKLLLCDVISFDIFDTLILRPFSEPTDLFHIIGQRINYMDFKRIRTEAEIAARKKKFKEQGSYEVNIAEIWNQVEQVTGIDAELGMQLEIETELEFCYANPYMKKIYDELIARGKHVVITSDMYLPADVLKKILAKCGYTGYEYLFVSCDENKSKVEGDLYQLVKSKYTALDDEPKKFAHIGDNPVSDVKKAEENGFGAFHYKNVNANSLLYRAYDMSPIIGGAYRGIVNNAIYSQANNFTLNKEYGFIYGGLFVLGYCHFIHEYCANHSVDKILFLSRDGEIIKRAYDYLYPDDDTEYVYISRLAAVKWSAQFMKYDFLRKMVYHKVNQGKSLSKVLDEMELSTIADAIFQDTCSLDKELTSKNIDSFIDAIDKNWNSVLETYRPQVKAAGDYYRAVIGHAKSAVAVDIGWAGSGAIALKTLFENAWNIDCRLTGIVAGTNTATNSEPDMSETMLLDGSLVSYLYSSRDNRDLWKKHNPSKGYNLYFELLTSSAQPSFKGFYYDDTDGSIQARFGNPEPNPEGIKEIQDGIMQFITEYQAHFKNYPYMFNISGRDAYAPMFLAASHNEKYLKAVYKNFGLTEGVE